MEDDEVTKERKEVLDLWRSIREELKKLAEVLVGEKGKNPGPTVDVPAPPEPEPKPEPKPEPAEKTPEQKRRGVLDLFW